MFLFISDDKVMLTTIKPKFQLDIFGSFQNAFSDFFQEKNNFMSSLYVDLRFY